VKVELAHPFTALDCSAVHLTEADQQELGPLFAVAVGLGLRTPGDKAA